jgi:GntR family transcriptional regulator
MTVASAHAVAAAVGVPGDVFDKARFEAETATPLYLRLRKIVRDAVRAGRLGETEALPSERDLAERLGVSRVTVRKAIEGLVKEGVLVQRAGSGTYVAPRRSRIEQPLSHLTSFTQDMASRGLAADQIWLDRSVGMPSPEEAMVLGLSPGDAVARFHRLRRAGGEPLAIELAVVPLRYLPDPTEVETSLYAVLGRHGHRPVRALQRLQATALMPEDAQRLGLAAGSPALFIQRVSYLPDGRVVEFVRSHYRGDAYDFVAELTVAPAEQETP